MAISVLGSLYLRNPLVFGCTWSPSPTLTVSDCFEMKVNGIHLLITIPTPLLLGVLFDSYTSPTHCFLSHLISPGLKWSSYRKAISEDSFFKRCRTFCCLTLSSTQFTFPVVTVNLFGFVLI